MSHIPRVALFDRNVEPTDEALAAIVEAAMVGVASRTAGAHDALVARFDAQLKVALARRARSSPKPAAFPRERSPTG